MTRLNWSSHRQGPGEFDDITPTEVDYSFDHRRNVTPGAKSSWPEKFGPANIRKAWRAGLVVVAEIEGFPHPVAVSEARWVAQVLEVKTLEGYRIAERLWTRPDARGLRSTGELIE